MNRIIATASLALALAAPLWAQPKPAAPLPAFEKGMWLCHTRVAAFNFENDWITLAEHIAVTANDLDHVGQKNECAFVASDHLKPIAVEEGEVRAMLPCAGLAVEVKDGVHSGWAGWRSYLSYMSYHVVRSCKEVQCRQ